MALLVLDRGLLYLELLIGVSMQKELTVAVTYLLVLPDGLQIKILQSCRAS